tara:strand:- start:18152 stop:18805 length:654 start_codon:yes stop_codon:yes gene_type:complete
MNNRNDRTIRAIVAIGSLVAILAIGIPWVDEYISLGRDASELSELRVELIDAQERNAQLDRLEKKLVRRLAVLSQRSVGTDDMADIRDTLIGMIRDAGARLRNLDVGNSDARVWAMDDDHPRAATMPQYADESEYELLTHTVDLRADGSLESIRKIMSGILDQGWLMTTTNMKIVPTGVRESPISIELRLVLYGLQDRPEEELEEDFASRIGETKLR